MDNLEKSINDTFEKIFDEVYKMDELKRKLISYLQDYLRERMDFIASIPTMDPLWTAPFDIIGDIIEPLLDDIKDESGSPTNKCPRLFLLLDNILRSENIRAGGLAFETKIKKDGKTVTWKSFFEIKSNEVNYAFSRANDIDIEAPVALYLGVSGCQAFYGIIENVLRNSGRHSSKNKLENVRQYSEAITEKKVPPNNTIPLKITIEFDYEGHKYKDDFVKVKIYDSLLGWKNESGTWKKEDGDMTLEEVNALLQPIQLKIEKFGDKPRDGRIIDDSGKVIQGGWGMKEMRICGSFLRGFKIQDYEMKRPLNEAPVIQAVPVPKSEQNNNGKGKNDEASLGCEFFIPKVKNLFIVSKDIVKNKTIKNKKDELKNSGIYIEENADKILELQQKGTLTHEFIAIDIDDENNQKFIQENHLLLPYKLFFITSDQDNLDKNLELLGIRNVRSDKQNLKNLIISKTDLTSWLTNPNEFEVNGVKYNCQSPSERVMYEIYKRWNRYLYNNKNKYLPKVGTYYNENANDWCNKLTFGDLVRGENRKLSNNFMSNIKGNILLLHRFDRFNKIKLNHPHAIIPFAHGISDPITRIKNIIKHSHDENTNEHLKLLLPNYFKILGAGLTNVVIIDERFFEEAPKIKNTLGVDVAFALNWYLQNVVILNLDKENDKFILRGYKVEPTGELNQTLNQPDEIDFSNQNIGKYLPEHFKNKVHFLIIHQSIISPKIGGKEEFKKFISILPDEYKPWYVIITSGRGHPPKDEMPENTRFLDFSNLRSLVIDHPNKYLLTKILTSLKEEKK
jgi:hypothetical protein